VRVFLFVDRDGHSEDPKVVKALKELQAHCSFAKILGSCPDPD